MTQNHLYPMERVITPSELFLIKIYSEFYDQELDVSDLQWLW